MSDKNMRISIVIPVYNEAESLAACLQSIARQNVEAYEVIVVDNNSTDGTVKVCEMFDFVTVLQQPIQGVVHARNLGFDAAKGDIIGRVDADSILAPDWTQQVAKLLNPSSGNKLDAVSGSVGYHDMPYRRLTTAIDLGFRSWIARGMGREVFLYGANMALRAQTWHNVRATVCTKKGLHEDFDLALHLHDIGARIAFCPELKATVSLRRIQSSPQSFYEYVRLNPHTYTSHGRTSHYRMYPVLVLVLISYGILRLAHKMYDQNTDTFNLSNLFLPPRAAYYRVNPATFVD